MHSATFHGPNLEVDVTALKSRSDTVPLLPGSFTTVLSKTLYKYTGSWLIHCHNDDHFSKGMVAMYSYYDSMSKSIIALVPIYATRWLCKF